MLGIPIHWIIMITVFVLTSQIIDLRKYLLYFKHHVHY